MKVKVKWIDAFAVACGNLLATKNIKEFELDSLIELEATPVEEVNKECEKELKRLNDFKNYTDIQYLNQEIDQIYQAINELRKEIKF